MTTPDPLSPWLIPSQEWAYFIPETPEQIKAALSTTDAKLVDNEDDDG